MTSLTDEQLYELGVKAFGSIEEDELHQTTAYAIASEDGTVVNPKYWSCHAYFMNYRDRKSTTKLSNNKVPIVIAHSIQYKHYGYKNCKQEYINLFYDYLMNRSPYKDCYVSKDVNKLMDEGIIVRLDRPANLAIAAGIATRHPWEYPFIPGTFYHLVSSGVNEDKAFLSSFLISITEREVENNSYTKRITHGHTSIYPGWLSKSGVKNFLNHQVPQKSDYNSKNYTEVLSYLSIELMWNNEPRYVYYDSSGNIKPLLKFDSVTSIKQSTDPFGVIQRVAVQQKKEKTLVEKVEEVFERALA